MINGLIDSSQVRRLNKEVEDIVVLPDSEKWEIINSLIADPNYDISYRTGVAYTDTTFDMSELLATILSFANKSFVNKTGMPVLNIGGIMLSRKKERQDYEWFGKQLESFMKKIGKRQNKIFRYLSLKKINLS